ncbi:MAG: adenosylcobinamide-GDP ribazoletransferase [Bacteroidetes bacterium]|nr:adenosylcobinamide-GDP ribazoletransferase [Bacteroidota bacterium]
MKKEIDIFFTALMFYTRIPCPPNITHDPEYLNKATRYFPLMGWVVGGICALVYWLSAHIFSIPIALLLSMVAGIITTGAFHEDGFADVCDGFGGGWTKEKILEIMKDSRTGAYGAIGIGLLLLFKFVALTEIPISQLFIVIIAAHSFSRLCAVGMIASSVYVRENEDAKAKPLAKTITVKEIVPATILGIAPLFLLGKFSIAILLPIAILIYMRSYFHKWIGGYTGDCLGAIQQVTELAFYLGILAAWKFI